MAEESDEEPSWGGGEDREAMEDFAESPEELVAHGENGGAERSPGRTEDDEEDLEW
jgi:hypothetical protein